MNPENVSAILERNLQEALGAAHFEIARLRAANTGQAMEINRLRSDLKAATAKKPDDSSDEKKAAS